MNMPRFFDYVVQLALSDSTPNDVQKINKKDPEQVFTTIEGLGDE